MKSQIQTLKEYAVMAYRSKEWLDAQAAAHKSGVIWVWSPKGGYLAWANNRSKTCKVNGKIYKPVTMSFTGIEDHGKMLDVIYDNDPDMYKKFSPYTDCIYGRITNTGKIVVYDEKPTKDKKKDKAIDAIYKYIKEGLIESSLERLTDQYNTTPAVARYYFGTAKLPKKIKIWRASEAGNVKRGDFVTADKEMAELHMRTDKYKLATKVVPPEHLRIVGSSGKKGATEFVYEP